jgi:hypothetical protein
MLNCYAEQSPPDAKTPVLLKRANGVKAWTTVGSGPIKGMYAAFIGLTTGAIESLYVVSGSELYTVNSAGTASLIGNIGSPNRIDIDSNTTHVVVVNEPKGYHWDGTTFGEITDEDFVSRGAGDVEFLDNFLLFRQPDSGVFFGADLGSATSFNGLRFATAEAHPDNLNGMKAQHRTLINFGTKSGELWENTGASGFPFERIINGTFDKGCLSAATIATQDNSVYWVADDFTVRKLEGITPRRVSSHAVEQFLSSATSLEAFTYEQEGHFFYVLSAVEGTFCFDVVTGEWAERETYLKSNWSMRHHAQFAGLELVGDSTSNKIGSLDTSTYTDFGATQRMEWTYQPVYAEQRMAFHKRLEVVLETGVGTTTGQGVAPLIMCQYSDDHGRTYKSLPDKSLGALGNRQVRAVWTGLGSARQRVYKMAVSDPIAITVTDTQLEVDGGRL